MYSAYTGYDFKRAAQYHTWNQAKRGHREIVAKMLREAEAHHRMLNAYGDRRMRFYGFLDHDPDEVKAWLDENAPSGYRHVKHEFMPPEVLFESAAEAFHFKMRWL